MKFSSAVVACFLFVCVSHSSASVITNEKTVDHGSWPEEYYLHITESGTMLTENEIDEEKDLKYFHVPAHDQVTEAADYLYDFKTNMAIQRVESQGICYQGPLPETLPKPIASDLKTESQKVSHAPPTQNQITVENYWVVTEQVDKTLLREEVQKFCDHFPIYRLQRVELNSANGHSSNGGRTRRARGVPPSVSRMPPFCTKVFPPGGCHPQDWLFEFKIRGRHCTWWLTCRFSIIDNEIDCGNTHWDPQYDTIICYNVRCP